MNRLSKKHWIVLGLVALAALASVDWKDASPNGRNSSIQVAEAVARGGAKALPRRRADVPEVAELHLDKMDERTGSDEEIIDIFKGKSWFVPPPPPPPPPPPKPVPPPPPTAPPLPYAFIGSYQGPDGHLIIFLTRGDRVHSVSPGDTLENTYRVDGVAAGLLTLTYLPLNIKQTMSIGGPS